MSETNVRVSVLSANHNYNYFQQSAKYVVQTRHSMIMINLSSLQALILPDAKL